MMTATAAGSSTSARKAVTICEQANDVYVISNDFTNEEANKVWYNEEEFYQMKINRKMTIQKNQRHQNNRSRSVNNSPVYRQEDEEQDEDTCLRGLERLLPGGNETLKRRTIAIKCIVEMYRRLKHSNIICGDDGEEHQRVLSSYSISKTQYARHTALYRAAQDAAAVAAGPGAGAAGGDRRHHRGELRPTTLRQTTGARSATTTTTTSAGKGFSSNHPHHKAITLNEVNESYTPALIQQQRHVPLRATMA